MATLEKALSIEKTVEINDKKYTIKKMPFGKYAKVLLILNKANLSLNNIAETDLDNMDSMLNVILSFLGESWEELGEIISYGSDIPKDEILNNPEIGLDGAITLFTAIYEINNLKTVFKNVKNLFARTPQK